MELNLELRRITPICRHDVTFGVLWNGEDPFLVTLELPWRDNQPNISCIPAGIYDLSLYKSQKHGSCLYVEGVPNRSGILFHAGNVVADTQGCIIPGQAFGYRAKEPSVAASRFAMKLLLELTKPATRISLRVYNG